VRGHSQRVGEFPHPPVVVPVEVTQFLQGQQVRTLAPQDGQDRR
jgi:hypothetical protein